MSINFSLEVEDFLKFIKEAETIPTYLQEQTWENIKNLCFNKLKRGETEEERAILQNKMWQVIKDKDDYFLLLFLQHYLSSKFLKDRKKEDALYYIYLNHSHLIEQITPFCDYKLLHFAYKRAINNHIHSWKKEFNKMLQEKELDPTALKQFIETLNMDKEIDIKTSLPQINGETASNETNNSR